MYENKIVSRKSYLIKTMACYLFDEDVRKKLNKCKLHYHFNWCTTDRTVKKDNVLYAMFVDSDTHKPTLAYFEVLEMSGYSQTALEMMAGQTYKLTELWDKLIYLLADNASVNNRENSG